MAFKRSTVRSRPSPPNPKCNYIWDFLYFFAFIILIYKNVIDKSVVFLVMVIFFMI